MSVCGHVGKNVILTVLLFDGLSVHPFVCSYTVLCIFLSVCLSTSSNIVCICIRMSVRHPACIFLCDTVCYSISLYVFFPFVRPSDRPSVRLVVFNQNECMPVSLLSINMSMTYLISNFLFLTSNF